jgi:glutaconate CoA-transferase subunit A
MTAMSGKVMTMAEAIGTYVTDGDTLVIEGFTHLICFAAGHEIIRQKKRDLVACRLTPDLIYDQMVAAGCVRKVVFSWAGNPGVGSLFGLRRAVERGVPRPVEIEEYSHFGMVARFVAGASGLPFMHLKDYEGSDLPKKNRNIKFVRCPYTGGRYATVPALNPDVAVIQVQRADAEGNGQIWGLMGVQREAAFASKRVIVVAEELVPADVVRADPNRTLIPGMIVDAVVVEPFAAHPSYALGYYDRDNAFYVEWAKVSKEKAGMDRYLEEWIHGLKGRAEYRDKLGGDYVAGLAADERPSGSVNYGF